jgi:3-phosphoshikimate 1-carboxyvinyltransferase
VSKRFRIRGGKPLRGKVELRGDKSIGHRALLFAALAEGRSTIEGLSGGLDHRSTADILRALGVSIAETAERVVVEGVGLEGLRPCERDLDCGNSGTTMRLFAGLLSGQQFSTCLVGDRSLSRRPMRRVVEPLRARGANIAGSEREGDVYAPLVIGKSKSGLIGLEYDMPVASAQVKSALLLAGLYARGPTALKEPMLSRDHTERMLLDLGVPIQTFGPMVVLDPDGWSRRWDAFDLVVPGDLSSAAFLIAAAQIVPGSSIAIEGCGVNPTRTGFLDALRPMGSTLRIEPKGARFASEPVADLHVRAGPLRATDLGGELLVRMIDEVPAFSALAARAQGRSTIRDARELRIKESDRIAATATILRAFGCTCSELEDGLVVEGAPELTPAHVDSMGDHRIAMTSAVLALAAGGESVVDDVECVDTSFPTFASIMQSLGGDLQVEDA